MTVRGGAAQSRHTLARGLLDVKTMAAVHSMQDTMADHSTPLALASCATPSGPPMCQVSAAGGQTEVVAAAPAATQKGKARGGRSRPHPRLQGMQISSSASGRVNPRTDASCITHKVDCAHGPTTQMSHKQTVADLDLPVQQAEMLHRIAIASSEMARLLRM